MEKVLKVAAGQAGLSAEDKAKVDTVGKMVSTHKNLLDMPANEARVKFQTLPADQQQALVTTFGVDPNQPKRCLLYTSPSPRD